MPLLQYTSAMNFFVIPVALWCDQHVGKIILEVAQMLYTTITLMHPAVFTTHARLWADRGIKPYRKTHAGQCSHNMTLSMMILM